MNSVSSNPLPTISIVTISFNQATFIERAIRSVVDQQYAGTEYIVVDPGSIDGSRDIIARYRAQIAVVILEPDAGPADGLNRGFARSSGEVLGFINADDALRPGALAYVADYFAAHPEVDVLAGGIRITDADDRAALRGRAADLFDLRAYLAGVSTVTQQGTFFRRRAFEAAGGFNAANRVCWDGELLADMALKGMRFARTNRVLGDFRLYGANITGSSGYMAKLYREHGRIYAKIEAQGIRAEQGLPLKLRRLRYKLDPVRHLRYLMTR